MSHRLHLPPKPGAQNRFFHFVLDDDALEARTHLKAVSHGPTTTQGRRQSQTVNMSFRRIFDL